jgi:hypothetical protein
MFAGPSVKKMIEQGIAEETAKKIYHIINSPVFISKSYDEEPITTMMRTEYPKTLHWLNCCHNTPTESEIRMDMINEALDGCGTEALDENPSWFPYPHYVYVNMGDTYDTTIIFDYKENTFLCGSWGDIAEKFKETA